MISLNIAGVVHLAGKDDQNKQSMQISVLPCLQYEIEVFAELFNRESAKVDLGKEYVLIILGLVQSMWSWLELKERRKFKG